MSEQLHKCIKCGDEMKQGLATGIGERFLGVITPFWVERKIKDDAQLPHTSDEVEKYSIATYRCVNCGYLESYATERHY